MKLSFILSLLLLALGTIGCKTTSTTSNSGAPPSGYATSSGQAQSPGVPYPEISNTPGGWQRWDYRGLGSSM